ncbi:37S ribosomal NAM9, mitochondrial [Lecanosticta acicola]|uniref:37S ribosomal NAM9, mitochondrial n=1 Tax=Lecanosticta acicola TaxID=111012 RepID=A0AAI8Z7A6_9PEZI|nr:37S ribosomal NAM9, mitochondrial [Lecanosticta acicola]
MPRTKRFHALKRPKLRQTWSKYNLYNLSRVTTPPAANKTFFQQKWTAKSMLRSYHNPDVREGTWTRMFDRRLPSVVPMDHRYLAANDGSEMAGGRGMGVEKETSRRAPGERGRERDVGEKRIEKTPYMHMTFHPLERRLDTAIFRAMFASSTREARQFVVHGWVKVNGKKMVYSGYQLNPGDMFQVDPDRVMFATGAKKISSNSTKSVIHIRKAKEEEAAMRKRRREEAEDLIEEEELEAELESEAAAATVEGGEEDKSVQHSRDLKKLMQRAKRILDDSKGSLSGKRLQDLRGFRKEVKRVFAKIRGMEESQVEESVDNLETMLSDILVKVPVDALPKDEAPALGSKEAAEAAQAVAERAQQKSDAQVQQASSNPQMKDGKTDNYKARKDAELLAAALERARANPVDVSKPYATPWQPRDWMSAFAFIPRYLEVNQNICSAVYLRHPVARPGLAEVPTPFSAETMGLGFNWYLRRR